MNQIQSNSGYMQIRSNSGYNEIKSNDTAAAGIVAGGLSGLGMYAGSAFLNKENRDALKDVKKFRKGIYGENREHFHNYLTREYKTMDGLNDEAAKKMADQEFKSRAKKEVRKEFNNRTSDTFRKRYTGKSGAMRAGLATLGGMTLGGVIDSAIE